jgi:hypothetical protein
MLDMAKVTPNDFLMDLGSGDGRTIIHCCEARGVRAMGIEYNPDMVELSKKNAAGRQVSATKATFVKGGYLRDGFSQKRRFHHGCILLPDLNSPAASLPKILENAAGDENRVRIFLPDGSLGSLNQ